jgi:hypothetical protein
VLFGLEWCESAKKTKERRMKVTASLILIVSLLLGVSLKAEIGSDKRAKRVKSGQSEKLICEEGRVKRIYKRENYKVLEIKFDVESGAHVAAMYSLIKNVKDGRLLVEGEPVFEPIWVSSGSYGTQPLTFKANLKGSDEGNYSSYINYRIGEGPKQMTGVSGNSNKLWASQSIFGETKTLGDLWGEVANVVLRDGVFDKTSLVYSPENENWTLRKMPKNDEINNWNKLYSADYDEMEIEFDQCSFVLVK